VAVKTAKGNRIIKEGSLSLSFPKSEISYYRGVEDIEKLERVLVDVMTGLARRDNPQIELKIVS